MHEFTRRIRSIVPILWIVACLLSPDSSPGAAPVLPIARWTFETGPQDSVGTLHGELVAGASVDHGRLKLNGQGQYMRTPTLAKDLREKTLEAWVYAGAIDGIHRDVISVQGSTGDWLTNEFDALILGELQRGQWSAGSDYSRRSRAVAASPETATPGELVHVAVTYSADHKITLYRNGRPYAPAYIPGGGSFGNLRTYRAGSAIVAIGLRNVGTPNAEGSFLGEIEEARLYDRALTPDQVALSFSEFIRPQLEAKGLVWIPPGRFLMGSPETEVGHSDAESPQPEVTLTHGFWMGKTEVTQEEYFSLMGTNPSVFLGDMRRPVEHVSWDEATLYCVKLTEKERVAGTLPKEYTYRLPTEAEWEYAARAGTTTRFFYGDDPGYAQLGDYAWQASNSAGSTQPTGQKLPNPWGLYDLQGNVEEFTLDWAGGYPGGQRINPYGPPTGAFRIIRGGDWNDTTIAFRSAQRFSIRPYERFDQQGFRVVLAREVCPGMPAGLVAWWKAEGDATDATGKHPATLVNGVSFNPGINGSAFAFDGLNDHVALGNWFPRQEFTIGFWLRPGRTQRTWANILDSNHTGFRGFVFQQLQNELNTYYYAEGRNGFATTGIRMTLEPDVWQFVVITRTKSHISSLFLNAARAGTATQPGPIIYDGTEQLRLGNWGGDFTRAWNGQMDEIVLFDRALSESEIRECMNVTRPAACANQVYWADMESLLGTEWSRTNLTVTPTDARRFLGEFGNGVVSLALTNLPPHRSARVAFDLYVLRSWDGSNTSVGPDIWSVGVSNGPVLLRTTFANYADWNPIENAQDYPSPFGLGHYSTRSGAAEVNTLGYTSAYASVGLRPMDAVYHLDFTWAHADPSLTLNFIASHLQAIGDESWGLDNVAVWTSTEAPEPTLTRSLVDAGSVWARWDRGTAPSGNWQALNYDDSTWLSGPAELGYGDNDEATVVQSGPANARYTTTYFRRAFPASDVWAVSNLVLRLLRDDGAAVYLNGVEVHRSNLPSGPLSYTTTASVSVEGADEATYETVDLSPSLLIEGTNVIAVEVHQINATSSDVSFDLELVAARVPAHPDFLPTDGPASVFTLERESSYCLEGSGRVSFTVHRLGALDSTATVGYQTVGGSALSGIDFVAKSGSLTFAPGEKLKRIDLAIARDGVPENDESFFVQLLSPSAGTGLWGYGRQEIQIVDEDGVFQLWQTNQVSSEGNLGVLLSVLWNGASNRVSSVQLRSRDGTAAGLGRDYYSLDTRLIFGAGQRSTNLFLNFQDDTLVEGDEWFSVELSEVAGLGSRIGVRSNLVITLLDNDEAGKPGSGINWQARDLLVQRDGKIVVGGFFTEANGVARPYLARFTSAGANDAAWSSASALNGEVESIAQQSDGKLIVAGVFTKMGSLARGRVARLLTNGAPDPSFVSTNGANGPVYEIALSPDDKPVLVGSFNSVDGVARGHVARLNTNGTLDVSFDPGTGFNTDAIWAVAVLPDRRILAGGLFQSYNGVARRNLVRLLPDGQIDTSFNASGSGPDSTVNLIRVLPDGKLLIGGWFGNYNGVPRAKLARLLPDGGLDASFNPRGGADRTPWNAVLQSDGKWVVAGEFFTWNGRARGGVVRLNPDGSEDTVFNAGYGANALCDGVGVLHDGKIAVAGQFTVFDGYSMNRFALLDVNGKLPEQPARWVERPGALGTPSHWYALTRRPRSWTEAEAEAVSLGGHLASVNDAQEQQFLIQTFLQGTEKLRPFWIGLSDVAKEGQFAWTTSEPVAFTRWENGEPNDLQGEDFVSMNWHFSRFQGGFRDDGLALAELGSWNDAADLGTSFVAPSYGLCFGIIELTFSPFLPMFSLEPHDRVVNPGDGLLLESLASAVNGAEVTYQWRMNGSLIQGATGASLDLGAPGPVIAGLYDVVATANGLSATSRVARVALAGLEIIADGRTLTGSKYVHEGPILLELKYPDPSALIYYTLDDLPPTLITGTSYSGAVLVAETSTLRVGVYRADFASFTEADPVALEVLPGLRLFLGTPGGGSVRATPDSPVYGRDAVVELTATALPGWQFLGWTGDTDSTNPVVQLRMTRDQTVQAVFGAALKVTAVGGGTVVRFPDRALYPYGTRIQLSPIASAGNSFYVWGGMSNPTNTPQSLIFNTAPRSVSALFSNLPPGEVSLTLAASGLGTVGASSPGTQFPVGTRLQITATPDEGQDFLGWEGDATGTANPISITLESSRFIRALFTLRPRLVASAETSLAGSNVVRVTVQGTPGSAQVYLLEGSEDLVHWTSLGLLTNGLGRVHYVDELAGQKVQQYLRLSTPQ